MTALVNVGLFREHHVNLHAGLIFSWYLLVAMPIVKMLKHLVLSSKWLLLPPPGVPFYHCGLPPASAPLGPGWLLIVIFKSQCKMQKPLLKIIKNFKSVTSEHLSKHIPYPHQCRDHGVWLRNKFILRHWCWRVDCYCSITQCILTNCTNALQVPTHFDCPPA